MSFINASDVKPGVEYTRLSKRVRLQRDLRTWQTLWRANNDQIQR